LPITLLLILATAEASDEFARSPQDVVVRRTRLLADALRAAAAPALRGGERREVAILVDVTPYTRRSERGLHDALFALRHEAVAGWRIAPLGGRLSQVHPSAAGAALHLPKVFAYETKSVNTFWDLRRSLKSFDARGGVVVYLADWHFEDDRRLERLLSMLESRGQVMSTIGSEAAFERAWNDGMFPDTGGKLNIRGAREEYDIRIGRDPFGVGEAHAPWHGGETAYPHLPTYFGGIPWSCEFSGMEAEEPEPVPMEASGRLEDLRERLHRAREKNAPDQGCHPLPSAWGPYGLMRLASETGGSYVLWSWNPTGRSNVTYDYARCNLFAPDLRSRRTILSEISRRPLARAVMRAWHEAAHRKMGLVRISPPVDADLHTPREMKSVSGFCAGCGIDDRPAQLAYMRRAPKVLEGIDRILLLLDRAIEHAPKRPDPVDRRLLADAHLFRHVLSVERFSLGEHLEVVRRIPRSGWDTPDRWPCVFEETYLARGADPEHVFPRYTKIFDTKRGLRVAEERRRMLRRYAGTPFAEVVARNRVYAFRFGWGIKVILDPGGRARNPAESDGAVEKTDPPTPKPGGGSGASPGGRTGGS
jgi:hypothetical protein